jgi:tRNA(Ile)-lysidine synthase
MPRAVERDGIVWARPWLGQPREAIEAYVRQHRLSVVEDPANEDARFARSRLRQAVWPALARSFPDVEGVLAAAAGRLQEAAQAVEEWSSADLASVCENGVLQIGTWEALPTGRRALVLRAWLKDRLGRGAPDALVGRLMKELPGRSPARWPAPDGWELRRFRGGLQVDEVHTPSLPAATTTLQVVREGLYAVPSWNGVLQVSAVRDGGVSLARLRHCELRARTGAEQFRVALPRPARSLKKQFQAAAIPPWQRHAPLLYSGGRLVFVPGLGIDADAAAEPGAPRVQLAWLPCDGAFAAPQ